MPVIISYLCCVWLGVWCINVTNAAATWGILLFSDDDDDDDGGWLVDDERAQLIAKLPCVCVFVLVHRMEIFCVVCVNIATAPPPQFQESCSNIFACVRDVASSYTRCCLTESLVWPHEGI